MAISSEILNKLYRYCAYQERCKSELLKKMKDLEVDPEAFESILAHLEDERFWDEDRFAKIFTRSKFFHKRWGRQKIRAHLQQKQVPKQLIASAFQTEIDSGQYLATLLRLITKRMGAESGVLGIKEKDKLHRFLYQKGYEWDMIREAIKQWEGGEQNG